MTWTALSLDNDNVKLGVAYVVGFNSVQVTHLQVSTAKYGSCVRNERWTSTIYLLPNLGPSNYYPSASRASIDRSMIPVAATRLVICI